MGSAHADALVRWSTTGAEADAQQAHAPVPDPACLYGLIGDVALEGSDGAETNPIAIAGNFLAYLSCAIGRAPYLPIGNTNHHPRLFFLHVGRSGRGRKGGAVSLVLRIDEALRALAKDLAPQVHRGGLSSREGLAGLIHDGYRVGHPLRAAEVLKKQSPRADQLRQNSPFVAIVRRQQMAENQVSPVLFLDFDGVLHPSDAPSGAMFCHLPAFEVVLRDHPSWDIVLSTDWRITQLLDDLKAPFSPDIAARIIGVTPDLSLPFDAAGARQREIEHWMAMNRPGAHWLAIDDRIEGFSEHCGQLFLVWRSFDYAPGLTPDQLTDLRRRLNSGTKR